MDMPEAPIVPGSTLQRQIAQMAVDLAAKLEATAKRAPHGKILDECEALLLDNGRQFLRDSLAATLQDQIEDGQKKGGPHAPVLVDITAATKGRERENS
jgi:hypothetical protein